MATFMNSPVLVTGGTGFLGRHLIVGLCRAGRFARVLTRYPERYPWLQRYPNIEVVAGDLRDRQRIFEVVQGCQQVIHAGSLFSFWGELDNFVQTNVEGTRHIVDAALAAGVQRFLYVSTVVVIGNPMPGAIIDETHPTNPLNPYEKTKLEAENYVRLAFSERGLNSVVVRPGAFYGPMGDYAFNRLFFKDAMRGLIVYLDGGHYITFPIYIADVVQGILQALDKGRPGEIYNLCGDWMTHREVFQIIREEAGLWWPALRFPGWLVINFARLLTWLGYLTRREPFYPLNLRPVIFNDWRVSSEKARRELGFVPTPFRDGARETIAWYRAGRPIEKWHGMDC